MRRWATGNKTEVPGSCASGCGPPEVAHRSASKRVATRVASRVFDAVSAAQRGGLQFVGEI